MKDNTASGKFSLFLKKLKLSSFILLSILCVVEASIYWLGNPIIYDGLAWHHIPEVAGVFFLGMWIREADLGASIFILICTLMPLFMVGLTGNLLVLIALPMFETPFIFGYISGCLKEKS